MKTEHYPDSLAATDDAIDAETLAAADCLDRGDRDGAIEHANEKARLRLHRRRLAQAMGFGCTMNGGCAGRSTETELVKLA